MNIKDHFGLRNMPAKKEVGIEIEMEGDRLPAEVAPNWRAEHDGSLRGAALEYVLVEPCKRDAVGAVLDELNEKLRAANAKLKPSPRCGVHVHLNVQHNQLDEVFAIIVMFHILEDVLVHWCGPEREGNLFCLRASDADAAIPVLAGCVQNSNFNGLINDNFRYAALNVTSLGKYGSLEFRSLNTPKDFLTIKKWVEILVRMRDKAVEYKDLRKIVEDVSKYGPLGFLEHVMGPHFRDLNCPDAEAMILDGVRRIQEVAYAYGERKPKRKAPPKPQVQEPPRPAEWGAPRPEPFQVHERPNDQRANLPLPGIRGGWFRMGVRIHPEDMPIKPRDVLQRDWNKVLVQHGYTWIRDRDAPDRARRR